MRKLLVYLKGYTKESILGPLFKLLEASFELLVPLLIAAMIDQGIALSDKNYIYRMGIVLLALGVVGLACSLTAQYFAAKSAVNFAGKLRRALFEHVGKLSFAEAERVGSATLITRMTNDVNQLQSGVNLVLRLFLRSPFIVFGAMMMAFTLDFQSALSFVVVIPLLSLVVYGIMFWSFPRFKRVQAGMDKLLRMTRENLSGIRVIRAFGYEKEEINSFDHTNVQQTRLQLVAGRISALTNPLTYILINAALIALIYTGAIRVQSGSISQGTVVALVNYMAQILIELIKLANLIITISKSLACASRVQGVLDLPVSPLPACQPKSSFPDAGTPLIEFEQVGLTYPESSEEALSDISFSAQWGQTIGIIGSTGSGKTSLVNLIPGFYQATRGSVRVQGIDVREYDPAALRSRIGVVFQKSTLFKGSIRENIKLGKPDATDEEILAALAHSQAREFVDRLPDGLDTLIEQAGNNLSGGQKQRLTIARALIRRPDILILDDSSSALDFATDARLRRSIREMSSQMTVFVISQRASSVQYADRIVVLEDGLAAGIGTHESLLASCPVYQEIYYSQFPQEMQA